VAASLSDGELREHPLIRELQSLATSFFKDGQ
jgi:hypothetical protein